MAPPVPSQGDDGVFKQSTGTPTEGVEVVDVSVKQSSSKPAKDVEVIDVDALPSDRVTPSSSGPSVAQAVNTSDVIDVDDPRTWTGPGSFAGAGSSANPPSDPLLKFDGELGEVLYAQKMEVMAEDDMPAPPVAVAATGAVVHDSAAAVRSASVTDNMDVVDVHSAATAPRSAGVRVHTLGEAMEAAREAIVADRAAKLKMSWPPVVADGSARAVTALTAPHVERFSAGAGPATQEGAC